MRKGRIGAIFSRWSIPAWALLAWSVLGEIHEGKFLGEVLSELNHFSHEHVLTSVGISLGCLFLFAAWPDYIQPWWPSWLTFKSLHERVHDLTHDHSTLKGEVEELAQGALITITTVGTVEARCIERVDDLRDGLSRLITSSGDRITGAEKRLSTLETSYTGACREAETALQAIKEFVVIQGDLDILIGRAAEIVRDFEFVIEQHSAGSPSIAWHADPDDPIQKEWLRVLKWHYREVVSFSARAHIDLNDLLGVELNGFMGKAYNNDGYSSWREALNTHWACLLTVRRDVATAFWLPVARAMRPISATTNA